MILPDMLKHAPMFNRIDPKQGPSWPPLRCGARLLFLLSVVFLPQCQRLAIHPHPPPPSFLLTLLFAGVLRGKGVGVDRGRGGGRGRGGMRGR